MSVSIELQIQCVKKELKRRKKIFPALVESGKLNQDYSDLELSKMQDVLETLTQLKGLLRR